MSRSEAKKRKICSTETENVLNNPKKSKCRSSQRKQKSERVAAILSLEALTLKAPSTLADTAMAATVSNELAPSVAIFTTEPVVPNGPKTSRRLCFTRHSKEYLFVPRHKWVDRRSNSVIFKPPETAETRAQDDFGTFIERFYSGDETIPITNRIAKWRNRAQKGKSVRFPDDPSEFDVMAAGLFLLVLAVCKSQGFDF